MTLYVFLICLSPDTTVHFLGLDRSEKSVRPVIFGSRRQSCVSVNCGYRFFRSVPNCTVTLIVCAVVSMTAAPTRTLTKSVPCNSKLLTEHSLLVVISRPLPSTGVSFLQAAQPEA